MVSKDMQQYHGSPFGGHFGYKKTKARTLQNKLWWSRMEEDVRKYCTSCQECQVLKGSKTHKYQEGSTNGSFPFQRVALDFWGPLPETTNGYKYILVALDTYTKFVELYPVYPTSGEDVAKTFYNNFILKHGVPQEVLQDNGPPFSGLFHSQPTNLLGADNLFTPAYHPQSNGMVERFMATLRRMILTYTDQENIKNEWHKSLRLIQFVYNNTMHSTTGFTPFYLVHGRHPRTHLVTANEGMVYEYYQSPPQEYAIKLQEKLNCAFDLVDTFMVKKYTNIQDNPYKIGQVILLFNQALSTKKKPRKLMFDWIGPYNIIKIRSKSTMDIQDKHSMKIVYNIHISRTKTFNQ
ncbi:hypothetical protein G6F37_012204 [Rhizopus arrhizus]|nr:hypothetical protein G6F38_011872 [Rhizopus arrhizus]KAG1145058.1 hypothetical protein G6F37_012204 [Rhizopus arrhizus]